MGKQRRSRWRPGRRSPYLQTGQIWLSREANLAFPPGSRWATASATDPSRDASSNTGSFIADRSGRLSFLAKPPGEWADAAGNFLPDYPHAGASGGLLVASAGLVGIRCGRPGSFCRTHERSGIAEVRTRASRKRRYRFPHGWQPLWRVGDTRMFREDARRRTAGRTSPVDATTTPPS